MTERHAQFRRQGYVTLPGALDADELATLRRVCDTLMDEPIDDGGNGRHKIGLGEDRRFLAHRPCFRGRRDFIGPARRTRRHRTRPHRSADAGTTLSRDRH